MLLPIPMIVYNILLNGTWNALLCNSQSKIEDIVREGSIKLVYHPCSRLTKALRAHTLCAPVTSPKHSIP